MRAAVVGGTAAAVGHHYGKKSAQNQQREADQDAQIADLQDQQQQQAYQPAPQAPAAQPPVEDIASQIERLKGLLDSGALTQEEYDAAKQRVLQGS